MLDKQIKQELFKINNLIYEFKKNNEPWSPPVTNIQTEIEHLLLSELPSKYSHEETKNILNHDLNHLTPLMRFLKISLEDNQFNFGSDARYIREYVSAYETILKNLLDAGADLDVSSQIDETKQWIKQISWMFNKNYINTPIVTKIIKHILETKFENYFIWYQDLFTGLDAINMNSKMTHNGLQILINYALEAPFNELEKIGINDSHIGLMFRALTLERMDNVDDSELKNKCNKFLTKFITHPQLKEGIIEELFSYYIHKIAPMKEFDAYRKAYFLSLVELNNLPEYVKQKLREHFIKTIKDSNELYKIIPFLIHLDINNNLTNHEKINKNSKQPTKIKHILDDIKGNEALLEETLLNIYSFALYDVKTNTLSEHSKPFNIYLMFFLEKALQFENITIISKYIPELSNINDTFAINNLEIFFKNLLNKVFEIPTQDRNYLLDSLQMLAAKFDDSTSKKLKDEVYYAILFLSSLNNTIPDNNTQLYCLENLDLFTRLEPKMLFEVMRQFSSSSESLEPNLSNEIFKHFLEKHPEMFFAVLKNKEIDTKAQYQYMLENFWNVLKAIYRTQDIEKNENLVFASLQQYLIDTKQKIPYMRIIPYIKNFKTLQKILQHKLVSIPNPSEPIIRNNATVNPFLLAATNENIDIFLSMFDHRTEEPWQTYWKHSGDPEGILIKFLLKMPITNSIGYTFPKEQSKAILLEALEVKSVIENLRGVHLINTIPNGRIERINWNENLNTLNEKIHTKVLGRSGIKKLLQRFLNLEKILALSENSASKLKAPKHSDSAHQSRVHNDAKSVFDKDFVSVINERYPNANKKQQIKNATIDARILIIKNFIEYNVTDQNDIEIRDKIVELCGLEDYLINYNKKEKTSNMAFADFKKEYYTDNLKFIEMVNPVNNDNSDLSKYLQNIPSNTDYSTYCKLTWGPFAIKVTMSQYKKAFNYQYGLIYDKSCIEFVLFNILLATEDIESKINKIEKENYLDLYLFANHPEIQDPEYIAARSIIQSKILKEKIDPKMNLDWEQLKSIVTKAMLSDINSLAISCVSGIKESMFEKSCPSGVFTRFSTAILSSHYKYATNEFNVRSNTIQDIMFNKFEKAFEQKLVNLILRRIEYKQPKFSFMRVSTKSKDSKSKEIYNLFNPKPKTLSELSAKIDKISDSKIKEEIIDSLFPYLETQPINNSLEIIEHDKEIANLFDAFFTVNTNNFFELFSGSEEILKYSAQLKGSSEIGDRISIENFDKETGRADFLTECFSSYLINDEIYSAIKFKDKMAKPLSEYEKALIKFYSIAIAEAPKLEGLSSSLLANLKLICDIKNPKDEIAPIIIAANTNVSQLKSTIRDLRTILPKSKATLQEFKNSLNNAIEAQYSLPHAIEDMTYEFDIFGFNTKLEEASIKNIVEDCRNIAQYLIENKDLRESYSNTERFPDITDIIEDLAYIAHEMFGEKSKLYQSCFNVAKALDIDNCLENQDAWKIGWDEKMKTKKRDYDIL